MAGSSSSLGFVTAISKSEFARRRRVTAARVTQWIAGKKIFGAALVGEGRNAQIDEAIACAQLRQTLDPVQMTANGICTDLGDRHPVLSIAPINSPMIRPSDTLQEAPSFELPTDQTLEYQIRLARLDQMRRANRLAANEERLQCARLVETAEVERMMRREVQHLANSFEEALTGFSATFAAEFNLQQPEVLDVLRLEANNLLLSIRELAREPGASPATSGMGAGGNARSSATTDSDRILPVLSG